MEYDHAIATPATRRHARKLLVLLVNTAVLATVTGCHREKPTDRAPDAAPSSGSMPPGEHGSPTEADAERESRPNGPPFAPPRNAAGAVAQPETLDEAIAFLQRGISKEFANTLRQEETRYVHIQRESWIDRPVAPNENTPEVVYEVVSSRYREAPVMDQLQRLGFFKCDRVELLLDVLWREVRGERARVASDVTAFRAAGAFACGDDGKPLRAWASFADSHAKLQGVWRCPAGHYWMRTPDGWRHAVPEFERQIEAEARRRVSCSSASLNCIVARD